MGQSHEKVGAMRVESDSLLFKIFWLGPIISWIFKTFILLNRTTSQLEGPCSSSDTNLESDNELCVYRSLITAYPERQLFGILNAYALLQLGFTVRELMYQILWCPDRQLSYTRWFLLAAYIDGL
jgi:hypothetical protein